MKKYVFYDKRTGEIVHTHRHYKIDSEKLEKLTRKELMRTLERKTDRVNLDVCTANIPERSSNSAIVLISPKSKRPKIIKLSRDHWKKIAAKKLKIEKDLEGGIG